MSALKMTARDRVVQMALGGTPPREIARKTGLSVNTIYSDLSWARKNGVDLPHFTTGAERRSGTRVVNVPDHILAALSHAALARGVSTPKLVERLLTAIARDDLVEAVLDDGETR